MSFCIKIYEGICSVVGFIGGLFIFNYYLKGKIYRISVGRGFDILEVILEFDKTKTISKQYLVAFRYTSC